MESKTLTIMFTDMKGWTPRTSNQSRAETVSLVQKQRDLILPVVEGRGGKLVKTIGDAFMFTFESSTDAVLTGIALQDALDAYNAEQEDSDQELLIRVAINTGEVTLDQGDVYGEAVNIASRIEGISEANEVYFTEATYLSMNRSEVPTAEIGYRVLKGIPDKIKVFKVLREPKNNKKSVKPAGKRLAAKVALGMGEDAEGEWLRPPHWRRAGAFFIDFLMLLTLIALLSIGKVSPSAELGSTRAQAAQAIEEQKSALASLNAENMAVLKAEEAKLMSDLESEYETIVKQALWTRRPLPEGLPYTDEILAFREKRAEIIQSLPRNLRQVLKEEAEPLLAQLSEARAATITQALWEGNPLFSGTPLQKVIQGFHDHRDGLQEKAQALAKEAAVSEAHLQELEQEIVQKVAQQERAKKGLALLLGVIVFFLYNIVALALWGKTFGKHLFRLEVEKVDGHPLGWVGAILRSILYILSALPALLGFVWILFDPKRQGWHDKIAESRVVFLPKEGEPPLP